MPSTPIPDDKGRDASTKDVPEDKAPDVGRLPLPPPPAPAPEANKGNETAADPPSIRDDIPIPDLKLIRRIGSGAYGEVWLAKTITGALRAVKVVWREDFEFEKTFQREFEGIKQFEPISRGHKGLVNILHVGWNDKAGFYYCVMELADDIETGQKFDIDHYVPRTLTSDFKRVGRLGLEHCRETGIFLADALGYMHSYGLTHRDIKPSNIIYVDGSCKLADIGLVAAHGERTFVGTEGFVPPEGPGTFSSDIYSLGKVLYEISSGKDRMEFPEVPDDLSPGDWKLWREWNTVICKACAPQVKDRFASAADFAAALREVGKPKPVPAHRQIMHALSMLTVFSILAGTLLAMVRREVNWSYEIPAVVPRKLTPQEIAQAKLPNPGKLWMNSIDGKFTWKGNRHIADKPVDLAIFTRFLNDSQRPFEGEVVTTVPKGGKPEYSVIVPKEDANAFCRWMTEEDRVAGAMNADYEYQWKPDGSVKGNPGTREGWSSIRLEVVRLYFGQVEVASVPSHAEVSVGGQVLGTTPLTLTRVRVGEFTCVLTLPGYLRETLKGPVKEGERLQLTAKLKPTDRVSFGKQWKNSLGLDFVPLGPVLMSVTEIRRADYAAFLQANSSYDVLPVNLADNERLPMTFVSKNEAQAFCRWLTERERAKGLLEEGQSYRLPTDDEWSMAANLPRERGVSPAERNERVDGIYPWGFNWPPLSKTANLWDVTAAKNAKRKDGLPNYEDGFDGLAPVASFPANSQKLHDMAGNVLEWVWEPFGGKDPKLQSMGVLRGGSWKVFEREQLLSSYRKAIEPSYRGDDTGFRVVLSTEGVSARVDE